MYVCMYLGIYSWRFASLAQLMTLCHRITLNIRQVWTNTVEQLQYVVAWVPSSWLGCMTVSLYKSKHPKDVQVKTTHWQHQVRYFTHTHTHTHTVCVSLADFEMGSKFHWSMVFLHCKKQSVQMEGLPRLSFAWHYFLLEFHEWIQEPVEMGCCMLRIFSVQD